MEHTVDYEYDGPGSGTVSPGHFAESRVLIIMTGGTICMQPSADGLVPVDGFLEKAMAPFPSFNDQSPRVNLHAIKDGARIDLPSLRTPVSAYSNHIRYTVLEFSPLLDSSSISAAGWAEIALTVRENYHLYDGFVVLHGTDSLAYTASALSFATADLGKPVVLTGSQASIFALQSDAVGNLLGSLIIAGTFVIPEVCLFFNHSLLRGNRATKISARAFEAFASPNLPALAKVTSLGVDVNWSLVRRPTRIAPFAVAPPPAPSNTSPRVACLRVFPGIMPSLLDSVCRAPLVRGLVLETFGMGNAPEGGADGSLAEVIRCATEERRVVVVSVSQCVDGFVSPLYAPGSALSRAGVISGRDLTTEAALTKLSYLLAARSEAFGPDGDKEAFEAIRRDMSRSLRGEMTEASAPVFRHPDGMMDPESPVLKMRSLSLHGLNRTLSGLALPFATFCHAIREGQLDRVEEMLDAEEGNSRLLEMADHSGNTAIHLAAEGENTDILRELLIRGGSVHARNRADNTPLFLAQRAKRATNIRLLKDAGAHLWETETEEA